LGDFLQKDLASGNPAKREKKKKPSLKSPSQTGLRVRRLRQKRVGEKWCLTIYERSKQGKRIKGKI